MEPMIVISILDYNELVMDKVSFLENIKNNIASASDMWKLKSDLLLKINTMIEYEKEKLIKPA